MSLFSKILDKLGLHRERSTRVGTTKIVHPNPPTTPSNMKSAHASMLVNSAPVSDEGGTDTNKRYQQKEKER